MLMQLRVHIVIAILLLVFSSSVASKAVDDTAPGWQGVEWINLEPGQKTLDVTDFRGKVVYLSFFQKW